jgi:putative intracellular protease/amidase
MAVGDLRPALEQFHAQDRPLFGTCAGLILLAQETIPPPRKAWDLLTSQPNAMLTAVRSTVLSQRGDLWYRSWARSHWRWSSFGPRRSPG